MVLARSTAVAVLWLHYGTSTQTQELNTNNRLLYRTTIYGTEQEKNKREKMVHLHKHF